MKGITFLHETDEGEEVEITIRTKYEVCHVCEGRGTAWPKGLHFTQSDFEEDPGLREQIAGGWYDRQCYNCHGLRVEEVADEEDPNYTIYQDWQEAEWAYQRECEYEMRYGY